MFAFLCDTIPLSGKATHKNRYQQKIANSFSTYYPAVIMLNQELYSAVYYFHKRKPLSVLDADNLSKPVVDALEDVLYKDDKMVKIRRSGIFDLNQNEIDILDLTKMPKNVFSDFLKLLDTSDHIIYVEFGNLSYNMFEFGIE